MNDVVFEEGATNSVTDDVDVVRVIDDIYNDIDEERSDDGKYDYISF